ncbi:MAG: peptide chain release factor 1 [Chloroflexota bacterium]|nr:MAG: peptide chain release factor 1 [Chloroflexota bacterium]
MFAEKFAAYQKRYDDLHKMMEDPAVSTNPTRLREITREVSDIEPMVEKYREYLTTSRALEHTLELARDESDLEMRELAQAEAEQLRAQEERLQSEMRIMLLPKDPRDEKDIYVEIRAGTGGEEAALFAADLYRMYTRYGERQGWKVALVDENRTGLKGFREVVFEIKGKGAFSRLKYESGVHRVQRVPLTESSGRIHTSTATVAVMAEVDDVEVEVRQEDLKIDIYHASGHGGQNVQKVATAVRITHLPTGIVVAVQDERSQLQNKLRAMSVLKARLYEMEVEKQQREITENRRSQVGSGERAEKIRTYNYPQDRVTDHRIGLTEHNLPGILDGDLDHIIDALVLADQEEKLKAAGVEV